LPGIKALQAPPDQHRFRSDFLKAILAIKETGSGSDAFKRDAVRIAQTSGLSIRQVASDLGGGFSTQNKGVKMVSDEAGPPDPDQNLLREIERLRRENRILKV
jgi:transposase